jgi:RHS repeat-associated protein
LGEGSYWIYPYDKLGQVISGKRYWSDGTPVAGQQFEYGFDDIGNLKTTGMGGDASGLGLRSATYTPNRLNQYTQRTVPDKVDILGIANPTAGVTVNWNTAYRKGEYFHHALYVPNSTAQYPEVTVVSQYGEGQTSTGKVYVSSAIESYQHDGDGNLTLDGRWTYSWDGENRLVEMKRDVDQPSGARQKLVFEYDHQGRRIRKQFFTYSGGWVEQTDVIFLYDGWNLMGELDANASNAKLRTYIWGIDLSGSLQGAGGVGGLLKVTDYTGSTTHHFVAYDGNGNVAALVDGGTGATTARYEYGPFGEPLRATGSMGKKNPLRFSTKFTDTESGLLYYGHRYYNPSTGRWLSRDPIEEEGGDNLYIFLDNDPVGYVDAVGLYRFEESWSNVSMSDLPGGSGGDTQFSGPYIDQQLKLKYDAQKCKCSVDQPETFILKVNVRVPRVGTQRGGTWVTRTFRRQAIGHEKKHVKIWKHYGQLWNRFEGWQKNQTETGTEQECYAKLTQRIQDCQNRVEQEFWPNALTAQAGHTAEQLSSRWGWIPSRWVGGRGWPWRTRAQVYIMTGSWQLNLSPINFPCQ